MIPILMLTKDRLDLTKQAVASVLENTVVPFKLVIFDNASNDGTGQWLEKHCKTTQPIEIFLAEDNWGIHGGMDWFHERFPDADFYAKVDNDTLVPYNWLGNLVDSLVANQAHLVGSIHHTCSFGALEAMQKAEDEGFWPFPSPGGSGIVYRREFVKVATVSEVAHSMMDGWTHYCHRRAKEGYIAGFCGYVRISLLDMANHFERREGHGSTDQVLGQPSLR